MKFIRTIEDIFINVGDITQIKVGDDSGIATVVMRQFVDNGIEEHKVHWDELQEIVFPPTPAYGERDGH